MKSFLRNPYLWLAVCFVASFLLLAYPIYVIRPFRYQSSTELALALQVVRFRPAFEIGIGLLAALLAFMAWKRISRLLPRVAALLIAALTVACGVLSFVNIYELMFHPLRQPVFKEASRTKLDGAEQVIAVKLGRDARAYPIRVISYHHIVNDVLAGVPIVATY
jgi:hypothetical protein